ncbi:MAG: hypothetical protein M3R59_08885 [Verrucomicrobiota bacterium]|nr:hypothetical protein [Verrucomicrobiota bacterium]
MIPAELPSLQQRIATALASRPECFVTHPAELALLSAMTTSEITDFAIKNGWRVVSRIGGRQIEFYNDVSARLVAESA